MRRLLDLSGIGGGRLHLRWVSAAEGQIFADYVKDLSESIERLGPFKPEAFRAPLAAIESTLGSPKLRWLTGMDRQLTEVENVYHQKVDKDEYSRIVQSTVETEYHKALILELLKSGPLFVRDIATAASLPVHTVALRLGELQKSGKVDLHGYEGAHPRFIGLAA